jgi:alcohol dehydrogenase class IV
MAVAALLSGICLTNAGLGAVHGFAAPLGARFPIPHGVICAALLPHVLHANITALRSVDENHPALQRYIEIARKLTGDATLCLPDGARAAVEFTRRLGIDLQIPGLASFNFTEADIPSMVQLAREASSMRYNPIALSDAALGAVLRNAL